MVSVSRYGREMSSVFDLLGTHEPAHRRDRLDGGPSTGTAE